MGHQGSSHAQGRAIDGELLLGTRRIGFFEVEMQRKFEDKSLKDLKGLMSDVRQTQARKSNGLSSAGDYKVRVTIWIWMQSETEQESMSRMLERDK